MSQNLRNFLKDLELISKIKDSKTQKNLLKYISNYPRYYMALKKIAVNVIKGNVKTNTKTKKKLKKHRKVIAN
jgi:hypothetical protein